MPLRYAASAVPAGMILPRLEHRFLMSAFTSSVSAAARVDDPFLDNFGHDGMGSVFSLAFVMVQFRAVA
jgi:hypothetical protein